MSKSFITIILFFISLCGASAKSPAALNSGLTTRELLDSLDSSLGKSAGYAAEKERRISSLRRRLSQTVNPEQRFWICRNLVDEYSSYNSDSALHYIDISTAIARQTGRREWIDEMNLNRAYIYAATGLLAEAESTLDEIDPREMTPALATDYYNRVLFVVTHKDQYLGKNSLTRPYSEHAKAMLDSVSRLMHPSDPQYIWFLAWRSMTDSVKTREAIPVVEKALENSTYSTREEAMNAWILSRLYELTGNSDMMMRYLILSAIADVRTSNKEIASLEEISNRLYQSNDLERANDYISHCLQLANDYKSRVRVGRLADLQYHITKAYSQRNERQRHKLNVYFIIALVFAAGLAVAMLFLYKQNRRIHRSKTELDRSNAQLNSKVEELSQTRRQLKEANDRLEILYRNVRDEAGELAAGNDAKERYIADIFAICSDYISKLDEFRRNIYRKIVAHNFDEVKELTKSHELSHGEIKELYQNFDSIFLKVYPNFVDDFNTLLRPDERVAMKKPGVLTTELRIYALVRLGINDSVKIARFLHCSTQSVYNARMKMRNKSDISKEQFAEAVRRLGKPAF